MAVTTWTAAKLCFDTTAGSHMSHVTVAQASRLVPLRWQVGYRVAVYEGLNSQHSAKAQLLLGVPSDREEWLSYSCDSLELATAA